MRHCWAPGQHMPHRKPSRRCVYVYTNKKVVYISIIHMFTFIRWFVYIFGCLPTCLMYTYIYIYIYMSPKSTLLEALRD